jgi:GNAT superfamily N-acetyltransferase
MPRDASRSGATGAPDRSKAPNDGRPVREVRLTEKLKDGSKVDIRRLRPGDAPVLADAFQQLGFESRRLRFMTPKPSLSPRELAYLTDVDGHRHEALGASDHASGKGVGVARFIRLEDEPDVAEVAVTVIDAWQRRGLGTLLLERLADQARSQGITHFSALISSENTAVLEVLRHAGGEIVPTAAGGGVVEYRTALGSAGIGRDLRDALRSAASGRLRLPRRLAALLGALAHSAH